MGHKLRIRPGIVSYEGAVSAHALRHAVQALHAGTSEFRLAQIIQAAYPDLGAETVLDIINQAKQAIEGAVQLQSQLLVVPSPVIDAWGYDPTLRQQWLIQAVLYSQAPSSWWTRLVEVQGETLPAAMTQAEAIAFLLQPEPPPNMGNPYPERTDGAGLRDEIPQIAVGNLPRLQQLTEQAEQTTAPGWFQIAYNSALSAGVSLAQYGTAFAAAITGVFRNLRG